MINTILDCEDGFFNTICSGKCGHCLMDESCDKVTGACPKGCKPHYQPPLCKGNDESIQELFTYSKTNEKKFKVIYVNNLMPSSF